HPRSCWVESILEISAPDTFDEVKFGAERSMNQPPLENGWLPSKSPICPISTRVLVSMRKSGHSQVVSPHCGLNFPMGNSLGLALGALFSSTSPPPSSRRRGKC